jgi:hypothetical protein
MAVITYDGSDVETGGGGSIEPPVTVYPAIIRKMEVRTQKKGGDPVNDIEIAFDLGGDFRWLYYYVGLEKDFAWKLRQLTDALGLPPKGKLDTKKAVGEMVRIRVQEDTYEDEYRARVGRVMRAVDGDELPEPGDSGTTADAEPEDGPEDDAETGGYTAIREDPEGEIGKYEDWPDGDVKEEFSDRGLEITGRKTEKAMIAALREDDEAGDDSATAVAEAEAEAETGEAPEYPDGYDPARETDENPYDDWPVEDLEGEVSDRGLTAPGGRGKKEDKLMAALRADDEAAGGGVSQTAAADDYDEQDLEDLTDTLRQRQLEIPKGRVTKEKVIEILRGDDAGEAF